MEGANLFAVDFDGAVDAELPSLTRAACEHGSEHGDLEPALKGSEGHLHVRGHVLGRPLEKISHGPGTRPLEARLCSIPHILSRELGLSPLFENRKGMCGYGAGRVWIIRVALLSGATALSLLGTVVGGEIFRGHLDGSRQTAAEEATPSLLVDMLTVVGTCHGLGGPFLLEKGLGSRADADFVFVDVVEIVFVPGLSQFLEGA